MKKLLTFLIVPLLALMGVNAQTDVTSTYLLNPSFESATSVSTTIANWTNLSNKLQSQNNTSFSKKDGTWYAEKWQSSGNLTGIRLSQQVASIPNGWYLLKVAAFTNQDAGGAFVYANQDSTEVFGTNDYDVLVNITTGTLEVGFKVVKSSNWVACDNFRLYALESTPYMQVSTASLMFDAAHLTRTFKVKAVNLTADIALTAPAGITLSKSTITPTEAAAGVVITATYSATANITDGTIGVASGSLSSSIAVTASNADAGCFTPLYTDRPNIISDPLMNSLSSYQGWGTKELTTEYVYCGATSLKISGKCGGSTDFGLTGKLKPNTMYRIKAMVSTNGTGEAKVGLSGATATNIAQTFSTDMGTWKTLDFTFTTKATLGTVNMYVNSCETQTATEIYVDNWEMYELFDAPTLSASPALLLFDALNPVRTFNVKGTNLISDITLTPPAGITLDKTTLTAAEANAGAEVTAEYDFSVEIKNDSIMMTGTSVKAKVNVNGFNGVENCYYMLYDDKTNLISDPLMNSLSTYGGWGNKSIVADGNSYCNNSGFINGTALCYPNSGSIDASITWKPFTKYRIYAMVRTENGTMNIGVSNVGNPGGDLNFEVPNTNGVWQLFDVSFTTGATAGAGLCFFNGCGASTGYIGYIDNWQIYELNDPNIILDPALLDFDSQYTTAPFTVLGQSLTENITLTAPSGITLDKTTITPAEATAGATVNATYDLSADIVDGLITCTSGSVSKTLPVNASKYLVNPSFERDITQGWTTNEGGMVRQSNSSFPLKKGAYYAEKWISSGGSLTGINLSQTVLGIPNGKYTVKASAQAIQQTDGSFPGGAYIIANASGVEVTATGEYSVDVDVTDQTLNVGFQVIQTGNWVSVDNFKLIAPGTGVKNIQSLTGANAYIQNERIHADINFDKTAAAEIKVYSVSGVKLASKAVTLNSGMNSVTIDKELTHGVYFVEIAADGKFAAFKLVK